MMEQQDLAQAYREQSLAGATGVELVIALYDGAIRFLHRASQCVTEGDVYGRRMAVKRATDILIYLQARLRPDVGGKAAEALGDFYAAMFQMALEASHYESAEALQEVVLCLRNVRDAWTVVARDPEAMKVLPRDLRTKQETYVAPLTRTLREEFASETTSRNWAA